MIVNNSAADQFLKRPPGEAIFYLVHGNDEGLIRERVRKLVDAALGDRPDPLRLVRLDGETVAREPGRLADEAHAISMFGGSRVVWIAAQGRDLLPALTPLFRAPPTECAIIVEAGSLKKGSELRTAFETRPNGVAIECYPDDRRSLGALIDEEARAANLRVPPDVREALCELLGADRMTTRNEVAKLMLYASGRETITAEDVQAIVSEAAPSMLDEAIDAAFQGETRGADKAGHSYLADGGDASLLLGAVVRHASLLHRLRIEMDSGRSFDTALQATRTRVFFARRTALERAADRWTAARLARLFGPLRAAALRVRHEGAVAEPSALRALWSIASSARSNSI
ncbi:MAG TPA: DNA polymerase III subunit delta [Roseiarcus sp.]|jgi:DNA polymerase-3 subunit delta|nr:DNA polymerase III subunit delta [Roseiarcus sp.]